MTRIITEVITAVLLEAQRASQWLADHLNDICLDWLDKMEA